MLTQNMETKILRRVKSLKKNKYYSDRFLHTVGLKKRRHFLVVSRGGQYKLCIKWQYMHKIQKIIKLHCNLLNITVTNGCMWYAPSYFLQASKNRKLKVMCVLHSLAFLSSAYQSLTPSAYATHVVGGKMRIFFVL